MITLAITYPSGKKTISGAASQEAQLAITTAKISFQELLRIKSDTAIKINQHSILTDYIRIIKEDNCVRVAFEEPQARQYAYKPKLIASIVYGNTNYYALILRLNFMKSVSDFTQQALEDGILLPIKSISDFLDEVLIKEKLPISRNKTEVLNDINSLP